MFRYKISLPTFVAQFCTIAATCAFLDLWRVRVGWLRVTAADYFPLDEDSDGLSIDERDCVNCPPCPERDELCREIDAKAEGRAA